MFVRFDRAPAQSAPEPVKLLLTATVAPEEGSKIAVTIFSPAATPHEQLWSRHYETLATGLPVLEFDIANDNLPLPETVLTHAPTTTPFKEVWTRDPVAYALYLRGRDHLAYPGPKNTLLRFANSASRAPRSGFCRSVRGAGPRLSFCDPRCAHAGARSEPLVKANALREIELDGFAPEGMQFWPLRNSPSSTSGNRPSANSSGQSRSMPDNPLAYEWYVWLLMGERRWGEAVSQAEISVSLDPNGLRGPFALAMAEMAKGTQP